MPSMKFTFPYRVCACTHVLGSWGKGHCVSLIKRRGTAASSWLTEELGELGFPGRCDGASDLLPLSMIKCQGTVCGPSYLGAAGAMCHLSCSPWSKRITEKGSWCFHRCLWLTGPAVRRRPCYSRDSGEGSTFNRNIFYRVHLGFIGL